jgi:hypothetical protein
LAGIPVAAFRYSRSLSRDHSALGRAPRA